MKINAGQFLSVLDRIRALGASKIESDNLIIHIDNCGKLEFAVTSRTTHLVLNSTIEVPKDDGFYFENSISVNFGTIQSVMGDIKDLDITIAFNQVSPGYINVTSDYPKYDIAFNVVSEAESNVIFNTDMSDTHYLWHNERVEDMKPLGWVVSNIGMLCVDDQFMTTLYRKGKEFRVAFITTTTMSTFDMVLHDNPEYNNDDVHGLATKTSLVPRAISQLLLYLKDEDSISLRYKGNNVFLETKDAVLRTSYMEMMKDTSKMSVSEAISACDSMKSIVDNIQDNVITMKVGGLGLSKLIKQSTALIARTAASKVTSYIPLYVVSKSEVKVSLKNTAGSYTCSITDNVDVDGLDADYKTCGVVFNMSTPIISSILSTLTKSYAKSRIIIEMKETGMGMQSKIYVKICSEASKRISYYIRLRK